MGIARLGGWKGYSSERKRGRHHFLRRLTQTNCNHARMIIIQKCVQTVASTAALKDVFQKLFIRLLAFSYNLMENIMRCCYQFDQFLIRFFCCYRFFDGSALSH